MSFFGEPDAGDVILALAQNWAEGAGEPGGAGTKSAKSWAAISQAGATDPNVVVVGEDLLSGSSKIAIIAADLNGAARIVTVADAIANVNLVGGAIANVNLVGGAIANVDLVGGAIANVDLVAPALTNIGIVAPSVANVVLVGESIANVNALVPSLTAITALANDLLLGGTSKIATVYSNIATVVALGTDLLLGAASKIATVATDLALGGASFILRAPQAAIDAANSAAAALVSRGAAEAASTAADWKNALRPLPLETGDIFSIDVMDADGLGSHTVYRVTKDGLTIPYAMLLPALSVTPGSLTSAVSSRMMQEIPLEGRVTWCVEVPDADGLGSKMPLYATDDGKMHAADMAVSSADFLTSPPLAVSTDWIVSQKANSDGTITLRSHSRSGGKVLDLVTGDKATSPTFTPDGAKVIYRSANLGGYAVVSPDGSTATPLRLSPRTDRIIFLGHSIIDMGLPAAFQTKTGLVSTNMGITGQTPAQIAMRFGKPFSITVSGNSIAGSGATALTTPANTQPTTDGPFANTALNRSMAVTVNGVSCILRGIAAGGYTIERTTPGAAVAVAPGTSIVADLTGLNDQMLYVQLMRNRMNDLPQILDAVTWIKAAAAAGSYNPRIIWGGELPIDNAERLTDSGRAVFDAANAYLLSLVGPLSYYDNLAWMLGGAMASVGHTPDSSDAAAITAGVAPPIFMSADHLHETATGRTAHANGIDAAFNRNWS